MSGNYSNQAQYDFSKKMAEFCESGREPTLREQAILYAQAVELQLLKAPMTAVFPPIEQFTVKENDGVYTVSGYVDSQNSYGATVRTPFTLNVYKDGESWTCSNKFVSHASQAAGNTVIYWVLGIAGTIVTYLIIHFLMF